jgi:hypothetical protein
MTSATAPEQPLSSNFATSTDALDQKPSFLIDPNSGHHPANGGAPPLFLTADNKFDHQKVAAAVFGDTSGQAFLLNRLAILALACLG